MSGKCSWLTYGAQGVLPAGIGSPQVTLLSSGKLIGQAVVDLSAAGKGGGSGMLGMLGGRLPLTVTGVLKTADGVGRFQIETAEVSGLPVPPSLLQDLITYYSRTPARPKGVSLDDSFALPASIKQIDVVPGQAVVTQ